MGQADVRCTKCDEKFQVDTQYFQVFGEDPFCRDCLIHTECQSCGRGLRLQPSRYQELGGDPLVCVDCDQQNTAAPAQSSSGRWFWSGLSIGEKIVFPILLAILVGMGWLAVSTNLNGDEASMPGFAGITILLYWLYHRGSKNS